jgi:hypothetical protein
VSAAAAAAAAAALRYGPAAQRHPADDAAGQPPRCTAAPTAQAQIKYLIAESSLTILNLNLIVNCLCFALQKTESNAIATPHFSQHQTATIQGPRQPPWDQIIGSSAVSAA